MSPRAAWRLEALGFSEVYDYVAGKGDWAAFGLPLEGSTASEPRAGDLAEIDVPTCLPGDDLVAVRERVQASGWDTCIVLNEAGIVLGRLGRRALASSEVQSVEEAMTEGPSTVRPNATLAATLERMQKRNLSSYLVTRSDGNLVGLLRREVGARRLAGLQ
jgi:CBS domain-containing protein